MQVYIKTDKLIPCVCGFKPDHYVIGYGRTPYDVWCPTCKKETSHYKHIGGCEQDIIDLWNDVVANNSKKRLNEMAKDEGRDKYSYITA